MIPAYRVTAENLMELVFAVSQLGPGAENGDIKAFSGLSDRIVREGLKIARELELVEGDEQYSVTHSYRKKIEEVGIDNRDVLLNRALIQYRPFRTFATYLRMGYPVDESARMTNVIHDIASDEDYIIDYFERYGEFAGLVSSSEEKFEITVEGREIPVDSVESVEALRNALESEAEVRFYIEETIGSETVARIDEDTENELVKAFSSHADSPRDSITASGRALEDFLRELGHRQGSGKENYSSKSGVAQVANQLRNESIIREVHNKRANSLSAIRNLGGAHGDDRQTGDRWRTSAELALTVAMETTLLIASISQVVYEGNQIL